MIEKSVFVQGSAHPDQDVTAAVVQLGQLLKAKDWQALVGAGGRIPHILASTGVYSVFHALEQHQSTEGANEATYYSGYVLLLTRYIKPHASDDEISWGLRLVDWIAKAQSFVFFPGDKGTLAHLFPVLAFAAKRWTPAGKPRKVALIGWDDEQLTAMEKLHGLTAQGAEWLNCFSLEEIEQAVEFITA